MSSYEQYFSYPSFRPQQKYMLDEVYKGVCNSETVIISAPTGCGKSTVVTPAIAYARDHHLKVIIAVRTKSQLPIFIKELSRIREKNPGMTFAYLVGKEGMCPLLQERGGNVYTLCENCKQMAQAALSTGNDYSGACEYYLNTYKFGDNREVNLKEEPYSKVQYILNNTLYYDDLKKFIGNKYCPYELCLEAARNTDIIVVNYQHILNNDIRNALYYSLGIESDEVILIVDEAHNIGSAACDTLTVNLTMKTLESANSVASSKSNYDFAVRFIDYCKEYLAKHVKPNADIVFSMPAFMDKFGKNGMKMVISDLNDIIKQEMSESKRMGVEHRDGAIETVRDFATRLLESNENPAYIGVLSGEGFESIIVKNIDPSEHLSAIADMHHAMVLTSGTLHPVNMYSKYYFGNKSTRKVILDNQFPKENRRVFVTTDVSSIYAKRNLPQTIKAYKTYIEKMCTFNGNVAVFFPSYAMQKQYLQGIDFGNKEVFVEPQNAKEATRRLQEFMSLPKSGRSGIMMAVSGGKWSEGIDYAGDTLVASMVVGFPLATFSDVQKVINYKFKEKYGDDGEFIAYSLPALNKAMQALGRVLRDASDKGVLILADFRYSSQFKSKLPKWIADEMVKTTAAEFQSMNLTRFV